MLPRQQNGFDGYDLYPGGEQGDAQVDEYGALALKDGVAAAEGFVIPRGQKWQGIALPEHAPERLRTVENQRWLESVAGRIFALRNDPASGFTGAVHSGWASVLGFGDQCMWVDKRRDDYGRFIGLSYQAEHVGGVWVERDAEGNPMRVHRAIRLTAEAAKAKWRDKAPRKVNEALAGPNPRPGEKFDFVHVIERNRDVAPGRIDAAGKPWKACYFSIADDHVFETGGYRTLRRIVSSFERSPGEDYGRGAAETVLKALRRTQVVTQDETIAVEIAAKGRWLAPDDELDESVIALGPDGITYGGLDERGNPRLVPLAFNGDLTGAENMLARDYQKIDRAFYRDLLQINREMKTHISATRTLEEIGEKGILLGPLAMQEQEWFSPLLFAELDLIHDEGMLDDMPADLAEWFGFGGMATAVYDNNLKRMQEASGAAGYLRTAEQVAVLAQFDPEVVKVFQGEYPLRKVLPFLGETNGIPAKVRATEAERAAEDAAEAAAAQQQQLLEVAPVIAETAKTAAEAGAIGGA